MSRCESKVKTGKPIAVFQRHRRSAIGREMALYTTGAALTWWAARHFEGSFIILIFALPALGFTIRAFGLFLSYLDPGKRIGIYENGLELGRKFFSRDEIQSISFSLTRVTRDSGGSHTERRYNLHLPQSKVVSMFFSDEPLPFYFNHEEFIAALKQIGIPIIDELAPAEHCETPNYTSIKRDPALARTIQVEFERIFRDTDTPRLTGKALALLEAGNRERKQRRLRILLKYLALRTVEFSGYLIGIILILSVVGFTGSFLNEILKTLRGSGSPDWTRLGVYLVSTVLCYWCGTRCWKPLEKIATSARRSLATFSAIRKPADLSPEALESPHLLYLRSFTGEYFRYLETTIESARDGLRQKYETLERDLDQTLIAATRDRLPFFALSNAKDASVSSGVIALYVPTSDWVTVAGLFMMKASVVILNLSVLSESVMAELRALHEIEAMERTIVIIGEHFPLQSIENEEAEILKTFPYQTSESSSDLSNQLSHFLDKILTNPGSH